MELGKYFEKPLKAVKRFNEWSDISYVYKSHGQPAVQGPLKPIIDHSVLFTLLVVNAAGLYMGKFDPTLIYITIASPAGDALKNKFFDKVVFPRSDKTLAWIDSRKNTA